MIAPGCVNPLLLCQSGDPLDELGVIARSLRFRPSAGSDLYWVPGASTTPNVWTMAFLVCRNNSGAAQNIYMAGYDGNNYTQLYFTADGRIGWYNLVGGTCYGYVESPQLLRGAAAFTHVRIIFVAATGTLAVFLNGSTNNITWNVTVGMAAAGSWIGAAGYAQHIGANLLGAGLRLDGSLASFVFLDGQQAANTAFGTFHKRTNQFRPKKRSELKALADAGGNTSYFLPFDDITNTTTLCADASIHGNNWTPTGISLTTGSTYDSLLHTPTNVFPGWNTLDKTPVGSVVDGGLSFTYASNGVYAGARSTFGVKSGVMFFEATLVAQASSGNALHWSIGVAKNTFNYDSSTNIALNAADSWQYSGSGQKVTGGAYSAYGAAYGTGAVVGVKADATAGTVEFFLNGTSQGVAFTGLFGELFAACVVLFSGVWALNYGQRAFSFPVNAGTAKTTCTKNLPYPAVSKSSDAFVAVTDSGANIQATLAADRPGWANYIEIFKCLSASEDWRWRFSDDLGNSWATNNTNAKAAFPALSGTSYVAYGLKVSAANGISTGTFAHVNGVADTITDGLSNTRKAIILTRESVGGGSRYFYHPDLTAGKLLYLNSTSLETPDASISTVTGSGFTAAAALPSGTYRWVALAETSGFINLNIDTGNGSSDGPFDNTGLLASLYVRKMSIGSGASWHVFDTARSKGNVCDKVIYFDAPSGEVNDVVNVVDVDSNGVKMRGTHGYTNESGSKFISLSIGQAFRYANER